MVINIVDVEEVLRQQPHPLTLMSLEALNPAREPYRAILLQPRAASGRLRPKAALISKHFSAASPGQSPATDKPSISSACQERRYAANSRSVQLPKIDIARIVTLKFFNRHTMNRRVAYECRNPSR